MLNSVRLDLQLMFKKPMIKKIILLLFLGTWFSKMERKFGGRVWHPWRFQQVKNQPICSWCSNW